MQTLFRKLFIPVPIGLALLMAGASTLAATTPGVNGSVPGFAWSLRTTSLVPDNAWVNVAYGTVSGSPLFVAVGNDGLSMTSPDGVTWAANAAVTTHTWSAVTHNGSNQFVAVGALTTTPPTPDGAMYSADGVNWTTATTPHLVPYSSVAYGNGTYVAVSDSTTAPVAQLVMTSSDGITWTARTAAERRVWRDVAFGNGVFVAVSGGTTDNQVMRSTDNGQTWAAVAGPATKKEWQSVTYGAGKFVAVAIGGTGQRVMTSDDDGQTWTLRNTPADNAWYSVSYGNGLFVAVAENGTDRVMTSPDGITWTARSAAANEVWFGLTYGDGRFVAVSATGTGTRAMSSGGPCGDGLAYTTGQWLMVGKPCVPTTDTVVGMFGTTPSAPPRTANFLTGDYDVSTTGWTMYRRETQTTPSQYVKYGPFDSPSSARGYWLKSGTAADRGRVNVYSGTASPASSFTGCESVNGCFLTVITTVTGDNRYNLISNPYPYPVDWSKVRVKVGSTVYTPTEAQTAGIMSNQIWIWNGSTYDTWSDIDPNKGNLKYGQSFWVNVLPGAAGQTVELLIPAEVSTLPLTQAAPADLPWYLAWLDWVVPQVQAAEKPANTGWRVRLKLDNHANGFKDHTNQLGLWPGSVDGWDANDLIEMPPFASPYLTLSFPHPEWPAVNGVKRAGSYASDFRAVDRKPTPIEWTFEIKANPVGGVVFLSWEGDDKILKRSRLVDLQTGKTIQPANSRWATKGYPITLQGSLQRYVWRYLGP